MLTLGICLEDLEELHEKPLDEILKKFLEINLEKLYDKFRVAFFEEFLEKLSKDFFEKFQAQFLGVIVEQLFKEFTWKGVGILGKISKETFKPFLDFFGRISVGIFPLGELLEKSVEDLVGKCLEESYINLWKKVLLEKITGALSAGDKISREIARIILEAFLRVIWEEKLELQSLKVSLEPVKFNVKIKKKRYFIKNRDF